MGRPGWKMSVGVWCGYMGVRERVQERVGKSKRESGTRGVQVWMDVKTRM